jgi:ectoine hydroxylase-related dioxygenase (phytanoyl-CoA dioxygenase family)
MALANPGLVTPEIIRKYAQDGVVYIPQALSSTWLNLIETGIKRNLLNPGPYSTTFFDGEPGAFYGDWCNYENILEYRRLLADSPVADIVAAVLQTKNLWLYYDQIFIKEGGYCRRTPWHQDTSYWVASGKQLGSMWITLNAITKEESLECVAGSHRGPMYNSSAFDSADESKPIYNSDVRPRLPSIEDERDKWNIVSWAIEPGDVLILHPGVLHGGGAIANGRARRTLSMRFFGDDAVYVKPPGVPAPPYWGISERLKPGDALRDPYFPQIRAAR